ncbi:MULTISPECIES: hypothetical protein [Cupriavidus]
MSISTSSMMVSTEGARQRSSAAGARTGAIAGKGAARRAGMA